MPTHLQFPLFPDYIEMHDNIIHTMSRKGILLSGKSNITKNYYILRMQKTDILTSKETKAPDDNISSINFSGERLEETMS